MTTTASAVTGVTFTDTSDGVHIDAREQDGAVCDRSATLTIPADQRPAAAAAMLPAPPEVIAALGWHRVTVTVDDSAFDGPSVAVRAADVGQIFRLDPEAAEQMAAALLEKAAAARRLIADIEWAQDHSAPADRADAAAAADHCA